MDRDIQSLLAGQAAGDSAGLPFEGLRPEIVQRLWKKKRRGFLWTQWSCLSDDTEHAIMTLDALIHHNDASSFAKHLGRSLGFWLLCVPPGVGSATLRSGFRALVGYGPTTRGVRSAGNGPLMRAPIIGAFFYDDPKQLALFVEVSTKLTHTDPDAQEAALLIARVASRIRRGKPIPSLENIVADALPSPSQSWNPFLTTLHAYSTRSTQDFAQALDPRGVSGYALPSALVALHAWHTQRGSLDNTIEAAILCGGDTDSVAAIAGALAGLESQEVHPFTHMRDFPLTRERLLSENPAPIHSLSFAARNLIMLPIFLIHVLLRRIM